MNRTRYSRFTITVLIVFAATFGLNWSPIGAAAARRIAAPQGNGGAHQGEPCDHLPNPPGNANGIEKKCPETGGSSGISRGDFNADGFADLAIGEPGAQVGNAAGAGDVIVLYGSANGLTVNTTGIPRRQLWTEARIPAHLSFANLTPEADDAFGSALASGDFNGDGFSDLAIGIPNKKLTTTFVKIPSVHNGSGAVVVLYGSTSGLTVTDSTVPAPQAFDLLDTPITTLGFSATASLDNAHFGQSLAWGNFNGDKFNLNDVGDLAIGIPGLSVVGFVVTAATNNGAVVVALGRPTTGLASLASALVLTEFGSIGLDEQAGDRFGAALTSGDFNADGVSELAIAAPGFDLGSAGDAGIVVVVSGTSSGLDPFGATAPQVWSQDTQTIQGSSESGDQFGTALTAADFNGDGKSDLAIGVPNEDLGSVVNVGVVNVLFGSTTGLTDTGNQLWEESDLSGVNEASDHFGSALAAGDFNADGRADLAIGTPFKNLGGLAGAGEVRVVYGSATGLSTTIRSPQIFRDLNGFQSGAHFGASLTAWNFGHNELVSNPFLIPIKTPDLAIGSPFRNVGGVSDAGEVEVFYGSFSSNGLTGVNSQILTADSVGIGGLAGAHFGAALY